MNSQALILVFGVLLGIAQCSPVPESIDLFEDDLIYEPWIILPIEQQQQQQLIPLSLNDEVNNYFSPPVYRVRRQNQVSVGAEHSRRGGTNVNIDAQARLWQSRNGRSSLDANANYNRQFGGPGGTGRPNYGGGLTFRHRF